MTDICKAVFSFFRDSIATSDFIDIACDIVERALDCNGEDSFECAWEAIDTGLVYYYQQWEILEHYCNPQDADWDYAIESFAENIATILDGIGRQTNESLRKRPMRRTNKNRR